jgi:hypothetical protein
VFQKICIFLALLFSSTELSSEPHIKKPIKEIKEINISCEKGQAGIRYSKINGENKFEVKYFGAASYSEAPQNLIKDLPDNADIELLSGKCMFVRAAFSATIFAKDNNFKEGARVTILVTSNNAGLTRKPFF